MMEIIDIMIILQNDNPTKMIIMIIIVLMNNKNEILSFIYSFIRSSIH